MKFLFITCILSSIIYSQQIKITVGGTKENKAYLYSISGEKISFVDSILSSNKGQFFYQPKDILHDGIYRLTFNNKSIDFIYDNNDIEISSDVNNILDSLKVINSESNKIYYSFVKLNKAYKTKTELLQLILARYPKDDEYYKATQNKLTQLQNEYIEFINVTAQKNPQSFIAKYIRSAQLPVVDISIPIGKQLTYLKAHALDNVDFNNSLLINSDAFTNKTIEYLTYFRNPQLPKELLEKEFMSAVDSILNKAKVNQLIYQHITEYLIDGFKKFGFDQVLDYIVENYVIKDDLCLDVKTEGLIKRRIEQAKNFKTGNIVPNISMPDITGKEVSLKGIFAEKVLIVFYASWCPHCKELMPKLNEIKKSSDGKNFEVLAISLDTKREDWKNFVKTNCPTLVNVSDLNGWDGKAASDYFIYATPTMILVDKARKILGLYTSINELQEMLK